MRILISRLVLISLFATPLWGEQYTQFNDTAGKPTIIRRDSDGAFIPTDPKNSDYQAFLTWQKAGNTITPAVPISTVDPKATDKAVVTDATKDMTTRFNALLRVLDLDQ